MSKNHFSKLISLSFGVLVLTLAIGFYIFAWTEPSDVPPGCTPGQPGCDAPINISNVAQTKFGNLTLTNLYLNAVGNEGDVSSTDEIIGYNDLFLKGNSAETAPVYIGGSQINFYTQLLNRMIVDSSGNVGIGTAAPTQKLDVVGNINTSQLCIAGNCKSNWPGSNCIMVRVEGWDQFLTTTCPADRYITGAIQGFTDNRDYGQLYPPSFISGFGGSVACRNQGGWSLHYCDVFCCK